MNITELYSSAANFLKVGVPLVREGVSPPNKAALSHDTSPPEWAVARLIRPPRTGFMDHRRRSHQLPRQECCDARSKTFIQMIDFPV